MSWGKHADAITWKNCTLDWSMILFFSSQLPQIELSSSTCSMILKGHGNGESMNQCYNFMLHIIQGWFWILFIRTCRYDICRYVWTHGTHDECQAKNDLFEVKKNDHSLMGLLHWAARTMTPISAKMSYRHVFIPHFLKKNVDNIFDTCIRWSREQNYMIAFHSILEWLKSIQQVNF